MHISTKTTETQAEKESIYIAGANRGPVAPGNLKEEGLRCSATLKGVPMPLPRCLTGGIQSWSGWLSLSTSEKAELPGDAFQGTMSKCGANMQFCSLAWIVCAHYEQYLPVFVTETPSPPSITEVNDANPNYID